MGRKLYGAFFEAGFGNIQVSIMANADVDGRLLGMIRNMAKYAIESGMIDQEKCDQVVSTLEQGLSNGTYLVVSPQLVVTGQKPS